MALWQAVQQALWQAVQQHHLAAGAAVAGVTRQMYVALRLTNVATVLRLVI